jgi:hypothetical protein
VSDIQTKNNAITAYIGGPSALKSLFFDGLTDEEFFIMSPEDLRFHLSWDWMMPVWKKLRLDISSREDQVGMFYAMSKALDDVDLEKLHGLASIYCINWCHQKQIKL